ncbi:unnamed protein product, partial [marine sediment metagenome]
KLFNMYVNESQSIHEFRKGDVVTRVRSAYMETPDGGYKDTQLMGQKLIFLGIANGCIYLERSTTIEKILNGQTFYIPLEAFEEGWNHFEDPEFLKGKGNMLSMIERAMADQTEAALKKLHKKALEEENFELAAKIKKKMKKLKNREEIDMEDLENPDFLFGNLGSEDMMGPGLGGFGGFGGLLGGDGSDPDDEDDFPGK